MYRRAGSRQVGINSACGSVCKTLYIDPAMAQDYTYKQGVGVRTEYALGARSALISSDNNTIDGLKILLIHQPAFDRPSSAIAADSIESLLLSSPLHVDHCGDVYRGLARLGQSGSEAYDIAIIGVDGFSPVELEFFSIVALRYPHISVYVYSRHSSRVRLDRAIELGAAGLASAELIRSIVDTQTTTAPTQKNIQNENAQTPQQLIAGETPHEHTEETSVEISTPQNITPQDIVIPEIPVVEDEVYEEQEESFELEDVEPQSESQDEPTAPARVPWNRYRDTPARQAPHPKSMHQPTQTHKTINDNPQLTPRRSIDEPLLTEEELEALLGDDISAIVPNERDALVPDDSGEENVK